jgi:uncharacterized protein YdbL (DUF1318 family)
MKSSLLCLSFTLLFSVQALAISLQEAKSQGLVGEQTNGYLAPVQSSAEANNLVDEINAKRKAHYENIARKNNITADTVAKLAAQKAIEAADRGHIIQDDRGNWVKK